MAKVPIELYCWEKSHLTLVEISQGQKEKFLRMVGSGKRVCPLCKPENKLMTCTDDFGGFSHAKAFQCRHGHLTTLSMFKNGTIHTKWGEDGEQFENFEGGIEGIPELIDSKEISCNHTVEGSKGPRVCGCKLKASDDKVLHLPEMGNFGIKTKTRLGDWWDKQGIIHQSEQGSVVETGGIASGYNPSRSEEAHAARLNHMSRKKVTKKTDVERLKRATKQSHEESGDRQKARREAPRQSYEE